MVVGAEAFSCEDITQLSVRGHVVGTLSVDFNVISSVDLSRQVVRRSESSISMDIEVVQFQ